MSLKQKRHHRTFSEDERIQAQQKAKAVEDADEGDIGDEPEDPLMLSRDAKDWKVCLLNLDVHPFFSRIC